MRLISRKFLIAIIVAAVFAALVGGSAILIRYVQGPPFVLTITPTATGAAIQVRFETRDGGKFVSPEVETPERVTEAYEIALTSGNEAIPGGKVEFADPTILPGRFTMRFGEVELDVMSSQVLVNGVVHDWQKVERE